MSVKILLLLAVLHVAVSMPLIEDELPRPGRRCLIVYDQATGTFQALVPTISFQNILRPANQNQNQNQNQNPAPPANNPGGGGNANPPNPPNPNPGQRNNGPKFMLFL